MAEVKERCVYIIVYTVEAEVGEVKGVDFGLSLREFSQQRVNSARGWGGDANGKKLGPAKEMEKNLTGWRVDTECT